MRRSAGTPEMKPTLPLCPSNPKNTERGQNLTRMKCFGAGRAAAAPCSFATRWHGLMWNSLQPAKVCAELGAAGSVSLELLLQCQAPTRPHSIRETPRAPRIIPQPGLTLPEEARSLLFPFPSPELLSPRKAPFPGCTWELAPHGQPH